MDTKLELERRIKTDAYILSSMIFSSDCGITYMPVTNLKESQSSLANKNPTTTTFKTQTIVVGRVVPDIGYGVARYKGGGENKGWEISQ